MDIVLYILYLILGLVALVLIVILFVPVQLIVDSTRSSYMLRMPFVAHLKLRIVNVEPVVSLWVLGYTKELNLIDEVRKQIRQAAAKRERRIRDEREKDTVIDTNQKPSGKTQSHTTTNNVSAGRQSARRRRSIPWRRLRACLNSFQVRKASIVVDTGIDEWNAWLFPVAYALAQLSPLRIQPNFLGHNSVRVYVQNTVGRLLWAFTFPTFFIHHSRRVV